MSMKWKRLNRLTAIALVIAMVATAVACSQPAPTATPSPTATVAPKPAPTVAAAPAATPKPTVVPTAAAKATAPPAPTGKLPNIMGVSSLEVGSGGYMFATGFASAIEKLAGMKVSIIQQGGEMGRFKAVQINEAQMVVWGTGQDYVVSRALGDFATLGPQRVRHVFGGALHANGMIVKGDSNTKTIADLKGKRIAKYASLPHQSLAIKATLAIADLQPSDCVELLMSGSGAQGNAFKAGQLDASWQGTTSVKELEEMDAMPGGIRWLPYPKPEDKVGWGKFQAVYPLAPTYDDKTVGYRRTPGWSPGTQSLVTSLDTVDAYLIYSIVKALDNGYDIYKNVSKDIAEFTLKGTLEQQEGVVIPFHPGLILYLKEKGLWTDANQKVQDQRLKEESERIATFKK